MQTNQQNDLTRIVSGQTPPRLLWIVFDPGKERYRGDTSNPVEMPHQKRIVEGGIVLSVVLKYHHQVSVTPFFYLSRLKLVLVIVESRYVAWIRDRASALGTS